MNALEVLVEQTASVQIESPWLGHSELMKKEYEEPKWIIPGILPVGLTLLAGSPKIGKSWFCLQLCQSVAMGHCSFSDQLIDKGRVLYMALEDSYPRLQKRFRSMSQGNIVDLDIDYIIQAGKQSHGGLSVIESWLYKYKNEARLVIIDTLQRFRDIDVASGYSQDYECIALIQKLALERNVAVILVHHTRKQEASDIFDTISGTKGLMGASDTIWVLSKQRQASQACLNITGRDVEERQLSVNFDAQQCLWKNLGESIGKPMSSADQEIIEAVSQLGGQAKAKEIAKVLGIAEGTVKTRLTRMVSNDKIFRLKDGRGIYSIHKET